MLIGIYNLLDIFLFLLFGGTHAHLTKSKVYP
uniref:Uncharacterized protein n=1 Tax=Siphoviridae sp. ctF7F8 TaxID=2826211 RepID=A0A8S5MKF1_9CAUD|nr:MAG TPA: hypothetical protein [Siphoviridae sp. ctF7F8]